MTRVTRGHFRLLPARRTIAAFMLSASLAGTASVILVANASAEANPSSNAAITPSAIPSPESTASSLLVVPLTATTQFLTTTASNNACPASGGTTTPPDGGGTTTPTASTGTISPSVSPTVLGITFDSPPPRTASKPGGRLPFTGLPLTQLSAMASALVGAGLLLVLSKRRHRSRRH